MTGITPGGGKPISKDLRVVQRPVAAQTEIKGEITAPKKADPADPELVKDSKALEDLAAKQQDEDEPDFEAAHAAALAAAKLGVLKGEKPLTEADKLDNLVSQSVARQALSDAVTGAEPTKPSAAALDARIHAQARTQEKLDEYLSAPPSKPSAAEADRLVEEMVKEEMAKPLDGSGWA